MWESTSYDNAGGFYEPTQGAQTPGGGEKKRQRAQNLIAANIRSILDSGKIFLYYLKLEVSIIIEKENIYYAAAFLQL